ncbi:MAG: hypothetical protein AMJ84_12260 [Acidithiobacillales bacterium SM23_46]|nr:MAG: hypothetical protein AMJ84_12260 [Acidithiobacillales bacterium SM23_46]KPL27963.1 MAG: hypothetical protein AMJ72_05865 [Acidithiobacillales bacterium SM1_46]
MDAGKLRHKIQLQTASSVRSRSGSKRKSYTVYATIWAAIEPLSGRELEQAHILNRELTHKVTIRYRSGVEAAHRVKFGARIFDVNASRNLFEQNRWLELLCKELLT